MKKLVLILAAFALLPVAAAADGAGLDIAVANAGTGFPGSLLHLEKEHWMVPVGINLLGTAFTIKLLDIEVKLSYPAEI